MLVLLSASPKIEIAAVLRWVFLWMNQQSRIASLRHTGRRFQPLSSPNRAITKRPTEAKNDKSQLFA